MPLTDYIPRNILDEEGFVHLDDPDLEKRGLVRVSDLKSVRLSMWGIAEFVGVGYDRMRRFFRVNNLKLDADNKMSLSDVMSIDFSHLTDLEESGDGQRKRTHYKSD